jgi:hypothetical protein
MKKQQTKPMQTTLLPIGELLQYPDNPRRGNVDAIKDSLAANGQFRPIVVQAKTNYVLAGNHTVQAAEDLGWDEVAAWVMDVDDEQAKRIVLADNRTADLGWYDDTDLLTLLKGLETEDGGLSGTGYGYDDLADLENLAGFQAADPSEGFLDGGLSQITTDGVARDKSMEEKEEAYASKGVRTVILAYPINEYEDIQKLLTQARDRAGTDNNAEAVMAALRGYTA